MDDGDGPMPGEDDVRGAIEELETLMVDLEDEATRLVPRADRVEQVLNAVRQRIAESVGRLKASLPD